MIEYFQALMWTTAIIDFMMGLLVYLVFRRDNDRSANAWALGCLLMGTGMISLTVRQFLPAVLGFGVTNFIMIYAMVLFRNSFWSFEKDGFRSSPYPLLFCLYHGAAILLLRYTPYKDSVGWFAAVNWTLLYVWLIVDSVKLRSRLQSTAYTFYMAMLALGMAAWGVRVLLALNFQILSASDPKAMNVFSLFVSHAALIGQQFVYFALRFADEKNKKLKIAELNASLDRLWREREELNRARQSDRDNLLRDMHDGFGSQLSSLRLLAEHGRLSPDEFTQALSDINADLHLIIDTLNQPSPNLKDSLADMRYRLSRRVPAEHVKLHWRVQLDKAPELASRETLHILRILQEAINNALRHAKAGNIWIAASYDEGASTITASIRDDGLGMDKAKSAGRGMSNMQRRAREIGATLEVREWEPGTEVVLGFRPGQAPRHAGAELAA